MAYDVFLYNALSVLLYKVDSNGFHAGIVSDPDNVSVSSAAQNSSALYIDSIVEMTPISVTRAETRERSGQTIRQIIDGGVENIESLTLTLARMNTAINALSTGVTTNEENTGWRIGGLDLTAASLNQLGMVVFGNASRKTATGFSAGEVMALNLPLVQLTQTGVGIGQGTGDNPNTITYTVKPQSTSKFFSGQSIGAGTNNLALNIQGDLTPFIPVSVVKQFHIHTHWAKAGTSTFTLPYLPLYTDATATGRNFITKNGVPTALTSVAADGVCTIPSSPTIADLDKWVIAYPTAWVASA